MAFHDLPLHEQLRQLIDYNPETGHLFWRERTPDMFADTRVKGRYVRTAQSTCTAWNTKYAGCPALASLNQAGYFQGPVFGLRLRAHQAAWIIYYGEKPERVIDHINGIRTDNRIANLRASSTLENARNMKLLVTNTSGYSGVRQEARTGSWYASIGGSTELCRRIIHLGTFPTKAEAVAARRAAEIVLDYHPNHGRR